ncbi:MAG: hypothetical protein M1330_05020 [Armatimonadetes bacterium]|nr:hypothetical protein [Armatimonadota bacterium]
MAEMRSRPGQTIILALIGMMFWACANPIYAQSRTPPNALQLTGQAIDKKPRCTVFLIVCDGLTLQDFLTSKSPEINWLVHHSGIGLMSAVAHGRSPINSALLTLASGRYLAASPDHLNIHRARDQVEGVSAGQVLWRRTGIGPITNGLVNLNAAILERHHPNAHLLGDLCEAVAVISPHRDASLPPASLLAMKSDGVCASISTSRLVKLIRNGAHPPNGLMVIGISPYQTQANVIASEAKQAGTQMSLIIEWINRLRPMLAHSKGTAGLMLVSAYPPVSKNGRWARLAPALFYGPAFKPGLLTSDTTRTPGLISDVDIAPTILHLLGKVFPPNLDGHPAFVVEKANLSALSRLDQVVRLNGAALLPTFITIAVYAALVAFGGLALLWWRSGRQPLLAYLFLTLVNMPLAMLFAPLLPVRGVAVYTIAILLFMHGLALLEMLISSKLNTSAPSVAAVATWLIVIADGMIGQPLTKFSLLSSYQLQGIRFYGIGNEYMGVVIGLAMVAAWNLTERSQLSNPISWAALFAFTALVLGAPVFGANAGGMVAAVAAFGCAAVILSNRRLNVSEVVTFIVLGLAMAWGFAWLDAHISGTAATHMGEALESAGHRGAVYLAAIVIRKVEMNLRLILSPGVLAALAGLSLLGWLVSKMLTVRLQRFSALHPWLIKSVPATFAGALVALLFNDSGIVAAIFILAAAIANGLYELCLIANESDAYCLPSRQTSDSRW